MPPTFNIQHPKTFIPKSGEWVLRYGIIMLSEVQLELEREVSSGRPSRRKNNLQGAKEQAVGFGWVGLRDEGRGGGGMLLSSTGLSDPSTLFPFDGPRYLLYLLS